MVVKIVTDSSADLPEKIAKEENSHFLVVSNPR
jgi:fatty acid-binding protein DegV